MSKNGAQNNMKSFFWRSLFMEFFFNSGKNLSIPKNLPVSSFLHLCSANISKEHELYLIKRTNA